MKTLQRPMVRMALTLVAVAGCLVAYPSSAQAQQTVNIADDWDSDIGVWDLSQAGNVVWGTLSRTNGTVVKVRGSVKRRLVRLSFWGVVDSGTAWLYVRLGDQTMVGRYRTTVGNLSGHLELNR